MRVLFMGNNWVAWQVLKWLGTQNDLELVGLVNHPPQKRRYGAEILAEANLPNERLFDATTLRDPATLEAIQALQPDLALSVYLGYILKPAFIDLFPRGIINLHPSYLPYNRGAYPNVWSIIEETPAGVTLHYIDEGIDTGDIIAQHPVEVAWTDTAKTLYHKLEQACVDLFVKTWPSIRNGTARRFPQERNTGTTHFVKDVEQVDELELDRPYTGRELINRLRARTFPPYGGVYFRDGNRKIYVKVELTEEEGEA